MQRRVVLWVSGTTQRAGFSGATRRALNATMFDLVLANPAIIRWLFIISASLFLIGIIITPWLIAAIPEDYFMKQKRCSHKPLTLGRLREMGITRIVVAVVKNLLGIVLVCAGVLMLILPGQGILTIVIGLVLMNFPGKYQLELKIIQTSSVLKAINWLREKQQQPPLQIPD